jgi:photosystem II stability/assembly factor-like uncharacterized protein
MAPTKKDETIQKLTAENERYRHALEVIANPEYRTEFAKQRDEGVSWARIYEDLAAEALK